MIPSARQDKSKYRPRLYETGWSRAKLTERKFEAMLPVFFAPAMRLVSELDAQVGVTANVEALVDHSRHGTLKHARFVVRFSPLGENSFLFGEIDEHKIVVGGERPAGTTLPAKVLNASWTLSRPPVTHSTATHLFKDINQCAL